MLQKQLLKVSQVCIGSFSPFSISSDDYQYLQKSSVPTLHFQPSLPRLPIPELPKTCERYLRAQRPLLNDDQYSRVQLLVHDFSTNSGPQLQKELIETDKRNRHTSYISKPWFDMYLSDRKPLPINYNPTIVFINDPRPEYNKQLIRATNMVISSLRFMKSLRSNLLEPEVYHLDALKSDTKLFRTVTGVLPSSISWYGAYLFKAFPLDMSQFKNLFNTTRIPCIGKDTLYLDQAARHITVAAKGHIYKVNVLDESGDIIEPDVILSCLEHCLTNNPSPAEFPVGVLTTEERDTWAKVRKHMESIGNEHNLKDIDGALFNLILDDDDTKENDFTNLTRQYLHSDGRNRWFDKCFSLIINRNGVAGLNFEHSWGDGVAVLRYFKDVFNDSTTKSWIHPDSKRNHTSVQSLVSRIDFKLDDALKDAIAQASKRYDAWTSSLDVQIVEYHKIGRSLCKPLKISPDLVIQLAFQMAHYKQNSSFVATYESCSTSAFKHGRTETMRPCTVETKEFCLAHARKDRVTKAQSLEMIKKCSQVHGDLIKAAAMGNGFDRHLFALRLLAEKHGRVPEIFTDSSFSQMNHYVLSTSTLSSDLVLLGAFGPVVDDGYGIAYSILNDRLGAIVTSYKQKKNGPEFARCLQESFEELYAILK